MKVLVHYEVTNASLTKFDLAAANNTILYYNLTLNLTLENPSTVNYNFDRLEAGLVFKGQNLYDMTNISKPFYLGHETNVTLPVVFTGNHSVALGDQEASDFRKADAFDIAVKIHSEYSTRTGKTFNIKQEVTCTLKVPLNSDGKNAGERFQITKCDVTMLNA
ncbi:uncharacterized protein LOC126796716 [Argentina anserina]|uniref:uncharacterized protein LOC126796716 n=1 Tax=Argentina anserina TaxID=57926 RepID=UPI0021766E1D|nr:uncharacterized protein LOC126796716 [Potentilla anserina]